MLIIDTTIYKCEFCKKIYQKRKWAEKHELRCKKNPVNDRPCFHCNHLVMKDTEICEDNFNPDAPEELYNLFYCTKKKLFLYPPSVGYKNNAYDLGDDCNEPMPLTCDFSFNR